MDLGQKHEKLAEIRNKYSPKTKDKSKVRDLACDEKTIKAKIAAVTEPVNASVNVPKTEGRPQLNNWDICM